MSDDSRLPGLFSIWHDRFVHQGEDLPGEVCQDCPELVEDLKRYIEAFHLINGLNGKMDNSPSLAVTITILKGSGGDNGDGDSWPAIPGHKILGEIGRGGMGTVYKAIHLSHINRVVALKTIRSGAHAGWHEKERFLEEAKTLAKLQGMGFVEVYECRSNDNLLFFSMAYHREGSLADRCKKSPLAPREAAKYLEQIARTMHRAHEVGIIHRDLKPGNVLMDDNGNPLVTDFGLAKDVEVKEGRTRDGDVLGTTGYMAPEQVSGKVRELGPACDIFGLGATLYDLLTGRPPFRSAVLVDVLKQTLEDDPVPPRLLNPQVDRDLDTICLKCLEKDPGKRYATAEELADDLARYLAGKPIRARSYSIPERLVRLINQPRHDAAELRLWASLLWLLGGLILCGHLLTFALLQAGNTSGYVWFSRVGMFLLGGSLLWLWRRKELQPNNGAERQAWSIWLGYFAAYATSAVVSRLLIQGGLLAAGPGAPPRWEEVITYPFAAVLSGLAFFVMGAGYWGWYYVMGMAFFGLALLLPLQLAWAPVAFGLFWMVCLGVAGWHVRGLKS